MVECELDVGDKAIPQVKRKGDVNRSKRGDDVILRRANIPFGKIRTMIVRRHKLDGYIGSWVGKIRSQSRRGFVVRDKIGDDVAESFKEKEDSSKGRDTCFSRAGVFWLEICKSLVDSDEEVLVARTGLNRKAASEVTGSPVRTRDSVGDSLRGKHTMYIIVT